MISFVKPNVFDRFSPKISEIGLRPIQNLAFGSPPLLVVRPPSNGGGGADQRNSTDIVHNSLKIAPKVRIFWVGEFWKTKNGVRIYIFFENFKKIWDIYYIYQLPSVNLIQNDFLDFWAEGPIPPPLPLVSNPVCNTALFTPWSATVEQHFYAS